MFNWTSNLGKFWRVGLVILSADTFCDLWSPCWLDWATRPQTPRTTRGWLQKPIFEDEVSTSPILGMPLQSKNNLGELKKNDGSWPHIIPYIWFFWYIFIWNCEPNILPCFWQPLVQTNNFPRSYQSVVGRSIYTNLKHQLWPSPLLPKQPFAGYVPHLLQQQLTHVHLCRQIQHFGRNTPATPHKLEHLLTRCHQSNGNDRTRSSCDHSILYDWNQRL